MIKVVSIFSIVICRGWLWSETGVGSQESGVGNWGLGLVSTANKA